MSANNDNNIPYVGPDRRRSPDAIYDVLDSIDKRLTAIEQRLDLTASAFVVNDLGRPDYDGHRRSHSVLMRTAETMEGYKQGVVKQILATVAVFFAGLFATGFFEWLKGGGK